MQEAPAAVAARRPGSPRESELSRRIAELEEDVRACAQGRALPPPRKPTEPVVEKADPRRERELLQTIQGLERKRRACLRGDPSLVALEMTQPRATISGLTLQPGEPQAITLEFSSEVARRAEYPVLVVQEVNGKEVGGNTYLIRTGEH